MKIDADGTAAFEYDPPCQGAGKDREIPPSAGRVKVAASGGVTSATPDRPLRPAKSMLVRAVIVICEGVAGAGAGLDIGAVEWIDAFGSAYIDRPIATAIGIFAVLP